MSSVLYDGAKPLRVLDFDIENRPSSYWLPDRPTAEVTAIASCWHGEPETMQVDLLSVPCRHHGWNCSQMEHYEMSGESMLARFYQRYVEADMVTGHYIRRHDLPILNGALMELGMDLLPAKLTCDTKLDMMKKADLPASQEYLLSLLNVTDVYGRPIRKFHMGQEDWREANRLTPAGLRKTHDRVMSDVYGHQELRSAMLERGMLGPPKVWRPGGAGGNTPGHGGTGG